MKKKFLVLGLTMAVLMGALTIGGATMFNTDPPFGMEENTIQNL